MKFILVAVATAAAIALWSNNGRSEILVPSPFVGAEAPHTAPCLH